MKFKIGFDLPDGSSDYVIIEADTIKEIKQKAAEAVYKRNGTYPWSERLNER